MMFSIICFTFLSFQSIKKKILSVYSEKVQFFAVIVCSESILLIIILKLSLSFFIIIIVIVIYIIIVPVILVNTIDSNCPTPCVIAGCFIQSDMEPNTVTVSKCY